MQLSIRKKRIKGIIIQYLFNKEYSFNLSHKIITGGK